MLQLLYCFVVASETVLSLTVQDRPISNRSIEMVLILFVILWENPCVKSIDLVEKRNENVACVYVFINS